jgi:hypothetical protein
MTPSLCHLGLVPERRTHGDDVAIFDEELVRHGCSPTLAPEEERLGIRERDPGELGAVIEQIVLHLD